MNATVMLEVAAQEIKHPAIREASLDVQKSIPKKGKGISYAFDPTILLVIAELFANFLPLITNLCKKTPAQLVAMASNPDGAEKFILESRVKRAVGGDEDKAESIIGGIQGWGKKLDEAKAGELLKVYKR